MCKYDLFGIDCDLLEISSFSILHKSVTERTKLRDELNLKTNKHRFKHRIKYNQNKKVKLRVLRLLEGSVDSEQKCKQLCHRGTERVIERSSYNRIQQPDIVLDRLARFEFHLSSYLLSVR